jgi:hypothetical protein
MRPVLLALYDRIDDERLRMVLRDDSERAALRDELNRFLADEGTDAIPPGQYGDNLLHGLLAIRSKFDRQTGLAKLDLNLAMRRGERNG